MGRIRPYILAGGRSSRMGQDKAMLSLGGRTLLGRAVDTLRRVEAFEDETGGVTVTVVGERTELEGADRAVPDRHPGCGPLGGMEAALADLGESGLGDWAFFLPVDMPFLPAGLISALVVEWMAAAGQVGAEARACYPVVDGRPQPLVSLLHGTMYLAIAQALTDGQFKVTPVLQSGAAVVASQYPGGISSPAIGVHETLVMEDAGVASVAGWAPSAAELRCRHLWFSNLNTKEDFLEAETFAAPPG